MLNKAVANCSKKRGQIYQISKVDATINPPLYSLIDLMKDPVPGQFYKKQLLSAPTPNYKKDFFFVEKILGRKTMKKKEFVLVKFLYYPSKFNQYVPIENIKGEN